MSRMGGMTAEDAGTAANADDSGREMRGGGGAEFDGSGGMGSGNVNC